MLSITIICAATTSQVNDGMPRWYGHQSTPTISTTSGDIAGWRYESVDHFVNIPFASPPIGNKRFQPPSQPQSWNDTRQWNGPILPICPQMRVGSIHLGEEDCLYLDVYVPSSLSSPTATPLPVLFWIYGGAYTIGDKYEFGWYDGHNLVKNTGVILVTANYRLGALGFMALDQLRDENPDKSTGNYALQDQQMAMKWVQSNIVRFGGDPFRVTIFGESAGSFSVCSHLVMPSSWGLFSAAIGESGGCEWSHNYTYARSISETFVAAHGCNPSSSSFLTCIRSLSVNQLLSHGDNDNDAHITESKSSIWFTHYNHGHGRGHGVYNAIPSYPVVDMSTAGLPGHPIDLIRRGKWARVPVIQGTNRDEFGLFILDAPFQPGLNVTLPLSPADLNKTIQYLYGTSVLNTIFKVYPPSSFVNSDALFVAAATDRQFYCESRRAIRAMVDNGGTVYQYYFQYTPPWIDVDVLGVYHTLELDFVFGNAWPPLVHKFGVNETKMMSTFQTYWSNMATSGTPNKPNHVAYEWPLYTRRSPAGLILDHQLSVTHDIRATQCDYWDAIDT